MCEDSYHTHDIRNYADAFVHESFRDATIIFISSRTKDALELDDEYNLLRGSGHFYNTSTVSQLDQFRGKKQNLIPIGDVPAKTMTGAIQNEWTSFF